MHDLTNQPCGYDTTRLGNSDALTQPKLAPPGDDPPAQTATAEDDLPERLAALSFGRLRLFVDALRKRWRLP